MNRFKFVYIILGLIVIVLGFTVVPTVASEIQNDEIKSQEDEYESINFNEISSMSDEEKEQKYMEYLADEAKETITDYYGINDIDIEIASDTDIWIVNVKIDYSDSPLNVIETNQSIEKFLTTFFPEGTMSSVVTK